jgi:UDP-3-O-[3-hydroxymyristoyl] N-acetylglucosamine deacetylase
MVVKPAAQNSGITFVRKDVRTVDNRVPAHWRNVVDTTMSTILANRDGVKVGTVEHLMAALSGCGVDNAVVELDGPEVPIMDGSAAPFVSVIETVGTADQSACRKALWIHRPVEVRCGDKFSILMPANTLRITVEIDFQESAVGFQTHSVSLVNEAFRNDIAHARTFGFASDVTRLQHQGLAKGGSIRNAILVDGDRIINEEGLRYQNEFVRHKILDVMGDLALIGVSLVGHLYAHKPGHKLNHMLIKQLLAIPDAWSYTTIDDIQSIIGEQASRSSTNADSASFRRQAKK